MSHWVRDSNARLLDGTVKVVSAPGKGTRVEISVVWPEQSSLG